MPTPSDSLPELVEAAFLGLYESEMPAGLSGYELVPQKDFNAEENRPLPFVLFVAGKQESKRRPQPGVYDVFLQVFLATSAIDDPRSVAHRRAVAAFITHINDKIATKSTLNAAGTGLHLYDYFLEGQETRSIASGEWETEITLKVVCQAVEVAEVEAETLVDTDGAAFTDTDGATFKNSHEATTTTGEVFVDSDEARFVDADEAQFSNPTT